MILISGSLFLIVQNINAINRITATTIIPVSPTRYGVKLPPLNGSNIFRRKRLLLACKSTAGHILPDFNRSHAKIKLIPKTDIKNRGNAYHNGVAES